MKKFIIFLVFVFSISKAQDSVRKVVINLTTGDIKRFELYLLSGLANNIEYYKNRLIDIDVVVVIHGDAYKFFIKDLSKTIYKNEKDLIRKQFEIYQRLKSLHDIYDVKFEVCSAGLKSRKISTDNIYKFVKPVYTSFVSLVDYQSRGYALITIE